MSRKIITLAILLLCYIQPAISGWKLASKPERIVGGDGEFYLAPSWSPNAKWLAFTTPNYAGIWVHNLDSGELRQLTDEPAAGFGFSWSNSGEAIAARVATYQGPRRVNSLQIIRVASGQHRLLPTTGRLRGLPRWSKDDRQVYILGDNRLQQLLSGEKPSLQVQRPDLISYIALGKIVVNHGSAGAQKIIEPMPGKRCINLSISPDSRKLAFEVVGGGLQVMNTDGAGLIDLGMGFRPQWAPDSKTLVYMISEDDGHRFTASDIYTVSSDGSGKSQLTKTKSIIEMNPSWSPDGKKIAFDSYDGGEIYVVAVEKLEEK